MSRHGPESDQCHFRFRSISMFKCQDPILIWSKHVVSNYVYIHYIYKHTHISTLHNVYIYIHTHGVYGVSTIIYLSIYLYIYIHWITNKIKAWDNSFRSKKQDGYVRFTASMTKPVQSRRVFFVCPYSYPICGFNLWLNLIFMC